MNCNHCVLELDSQLKITSGSTELLNEKIAGGADIRISTGFIHNEHIDPTSDDNQLIMETSTFAETVLIDGKWSAYFMTLRQPVALREGFGDPNALSLFLYNQDGRQAVARLVMDGTGNKSGAWDTEETGIPKLKTFSVQDAGTAGVSKNFVYNFELFRYHAIDGYEEVYANSPDGTCVSGNIDTLEEAYAQGRGIKIAVKGISQALWGDTGHTDEIYIHCGSSYDYTRDKLMITNSLPFISVPADIPLSYKSRSYRYCWMVARSDGHVALRCYNPFDSTWTTQAEKLPVRWFAAK